VSPASWLDSFTGEWNKYIYGYGAAPIFWGLHWPFPLPPVVIKPPKPTKPPYPPKPPKPGHGHFPTVPPTPPKPTPPKPGHH
jgi:hypothetical protein